MDYLLDKRNKIDEVDHKLVELFENRMQIAKEIADYKKNIGKAVYDRTREEEKLASLQALTEDEFNKKAIVDLFSQIMSISRRLQYTRFDKNEDFGFEAIETLPINKETKVVFYGERGTYAEHAMLEYFGDDINSFSAKTFQEVMQDIKEGKADYGVLPIENSITGTLSDISDLLVEYDNYIIGSHVLKIEHVLLGLPGSSIENITKVYSHPQPILQCSSFLKQHPSMEPIESGSTASSARRILEEKDITHAAIASKRAGEYFGLSTLKEAIHNEGNNATRFIIISNQRIYLKEAEHTSICFALPHKSGSLYHMLSHFIYNNLNMANIESRPIIGKSFEYRFFVDIEGGLDNPGVKNALKCINQEAIDMKILGSYIHVR